MLHFLEILFHVVIAISIFNFVRCTKRNLPFDRVHDIDCGYGWIVLPWFGGYWIGLRDQWKKKNIFGADGKPMVHGYSIRRFKRFHNCTATRVY